MNILKTADKFTGRQATKTANMWAARVINFVDGAITSSLFSALTITTLEGPAGIPQERDTMICRGEHTEDFWIQKEDKVSKGYTKSDTRNGLVWSLYIPKPTKAVEFFKAEEDGFIIGTWGTQSYVDGNLVYLQKVSAGDTVARQLDDHADQWVVRKKQWDATYEEGK